jgi:hypothetical protein
MQFTEACCELLRIPLPRTPLNKARMAIPSLRLLKLANRVVESSTRYISSEGG